MSNNNGFEIPLSNPDISQLEIDHVVEVLRSGRLSMGPFIEQFESRVADMCNRNHAVAVSSGTSGLHLALTAMGIGEGDEVITTPFTFIAPANAIQYVGAKPVFADIHPMSLNMDPAKVEEAITPKTKAILAVENFGNPMHIPEVCEIARRHGIPVLEDACEGFGGTHHGKPVGSFGKMAVFAFYPNKPITTGEGGMIVTDDAHLADLCRSMRNQGRRIPRSSSEIDNDDPSWESNLGSWLQHERLGYNYRMSELHAALGVAQMRRLPAIIERRNDVAAGYFERLSGVSEIRLPTIDPVTTMSWFVFVVLLSADYTAEDRDRIIGGMRRHDIGVSNYFPPIHLQPAYRMKYGCHEGMFPICERIAGRTLALPFYNNLQSRELDLVCQTLEVMMQRSVFSRRVDDRGE